VEGIQVNAMTEPVSFTLPKKPRVYQKDSMPDQRKIAVMPLKALTDQTLTDGSIRVLGVLCSYCNRAGITWVSQARLAKDLNISRQAVTNQLMQLRAAGYVEIIKKGFRGERCNTLRVIFDQSVDAATAMAVTSSIEDTRSPAIKEQQAMEEVDKEGQRRVAQAISKVLKQPTKRIKTMPKSGETRTVREMKAAIQKAQSKSSKPVDNHAHIGHPTVSNESTPEVSNEGLHRQSIGHSGVSQNTENTDTSRQVVCNQVVKEVNLNNQNSSNLNSDLIVVLNNREVEELVREGISTQQVADSLDTLLPLYAAEGIKPSSAVLMAGIRQLQADAR
jgi:DNA-binding CsgD family transcriptional regulator